MRLATTSFKLAAILWLASPGAYAATHYAGPNGSEDGSTKTSPASATSAVNKATAGDTFVFLDGTYDGVSLSLPANSVTAITLRADDQAVPVLHGGGSGSGLTTNTSTSARVIDGLWFENYAGGIELDWNTGNKVSNLTIRYCAADLNSRNGISSYRSSNVTFENNTASRNGFGASSWSSNFDIYAVKGSNNVVRGNVAFHGIDTSSNQCDGNGFILDLTIGNCSALFESNIAFLNGGACIAVTDSNRAQLIGNTCYSNSQQAFGGMDELNVGNTQRGMVDGINTDQANVSSGLLVRHNVLVPTQSGKDGYNEYDGGTVPTEGNYPAVNDSSVFEDAANADFPPRSGSALIDRANHDSTASTDIGFDPKCIKKETDSNKKHGYGWWTFAPNVAYMRTVGGIKGCFNPVSRPQGASQDYGAYEYRSTPVVTGGSGATSGGAHASQGGTEVSRGVANFGRSGNATGAGTGASGGCGCTTICSMH